MKKLLYVLIFALLIYLFDLGNPDALRQGTEGFYLQVASEMFSKNSFLTPFYLDKPHWSKPPFLFLMPQVFYLIQGAATILSSRLSVLIVSLLLGFIVAKKVSLLTSVKSHLYFLFLFSSLGFYKYSRIYMMEMPLVLLCFAAAVFYYSYLEKAQKKDLFLSILLGALSCLVKGPVSIAMLLFTFSLYSIFHFLVFKKFYIKEIFYWAIPTLALSSLWFIYEYALYGQDFIDYFFIRENLGKFSAKSYPISNVFQGLLLYALPYSLLFPLLLWNYKKRGIEELSIQKSKFSIFLLIGFLCFFIIWLIPQQRSHHYAMPALPFITTLLFFEFFKGRQIALLPRKILKSYLGFFSGIGLLAIGLTFFHQSQFPYANSLSLCAGAIFLILIFAYLFKKNTHIEGLFISQVLLISIFWSLLIPNYILPLVPNSIQDFTKNIENIGTVHRKPYFISQSLNREVDILTLDKVSAFLTKSDSVIIIDGPLYSMIRSESKYQVVKQWKVWRRGIKGFEIWKNLKDGTIEKLRSSVYLIKSKAIHPSPE